MLIQISNCFLLPHLLFLNLGDVQFRLIFLIEIASLLDESAVDFDLACIYLVNNLLLLSGLWEVQGFSLGLYQRNCIIKRRLWSEQAFDR